MRKHDQGSAGLLGKQRNLKVWARREPEPAPGRVDGRKVEVGVPRRVIQILPPCLGKLEYWHMHVAQTPTKVQSAETPIAVNDRSLEPLNIGNMGGVDRESQLAAAPGGRLIYAASLQRGVS